MRITAILNVKHFVWGGYQAIETILGLLPIVDRFMINDGGSDGKDNSNEYLQRLRDMYPDKIELYSMPWTGQDCYGEYDKSLKWMMDQVPNGEWLVLSHADEMWSERNIFDLRRRVEWCDKQGYNSLRGRCLGIGSWMRIDPLIYEHVRFVRKFPDTDCVHWGDCLHFKGSLSTHPYYNGSNTPPEYYTHIPFYHLHRVWIHNMKDQHWAMAYYAGGIDPPRMPYWLTIKDIDWSTSNWVPRKEDVLDCIPAIIKGMSQEMKYYVREELFDKKWLTEVTGINYFF